jgi:hypothetical protein
MSKTFMPELPPAERKTLLQDNADNIEQTEYYKDLSPEELDIKRESLTENLIQLSEWEDELQEVKETYKGKMKPKKEQNGILLTQIKTRKELVSGTLYHIADHENSVMETYDENGEFVSSRRLKPSEKQQRLFPVKKAL